MTKVDVYETITNRIIEAMEKGVTPWARDWQGGGNLNVPTRANGQAYRGINTLILWIESMTKGYASNQWMTFKQAQAIGASVRKGEKSSQVVYFNMFEKEDKATKEKVKIPMIRAYAVFNADQIDGLPPVETVDTGAKPIEAVESFFKATKATIKITGSQPCYIPALDQIQMPAVSQFTTAESYYGTLSHELVHWTGHKSRLDRLETSKQADYAFEELVAELGACFLTSELGIDKGIDRSAAYLGSWLTALKNDKRFIFTASSKAQAAVDYSLKAGGLRKEEAKEVEA